MIVEGTWGFASHLELTPASAAATAQRAVEVARTLRPLNAERVELAAEPVHAGAVWTGDHEIDPFTVPLSEKVALLSASNFGSLNTPSAAKMRRALELITARAPELEIEGEMHGDAAIS